MKRLLLLSVLALVTACGSPEVGDSCSPENSGTCSDSTTALFCESGTLKAYDCRGPGGCVSNNDRVTCDVTRARAGDLCPKSVEGQGQCNSANANQALLCTGGRWTAQACNACAVQGGQVVCLQ
jgi:hypothetical protein